MAVSSNPPLPPVSFRSGRNRNTYTYPHLPIHLPTYLPQNRIACYSYSCRTFSGVRVQLSTARVSTNALCARSAVCVHRTVSQTRSSGGGIKGSEEMRRVRFVTRARARASLIFRPRNVSRCIVCPGKGCLLPRSSLWDYKNVTCTCCLREYTRENEQAPQSAVAASLRFNDSDLTSASKPLERGMQLVYRIVSGSLRDEKKEEE